MEALLGHSFDSVRIHTGRTATRSARDLDAKAYTVGTHVVFDHNEFDPHTVAGSFLLAHELVHVIQQRKGDVFVQRMSSNSQERNRYLHIKTNRGYKDAGHCWVAFENPTGKFDFGESDPGFYMSYGFIGDVEPDGLLDWVPGYIETPDKNDGQETHVYTLSLTPEEYNAAFQEVIDWKESIPSFNLLRSNCATFVRNVASKTGRPIPRTYYIASRQPLAMMIKSIAKWLSQRNGEPTSFSEVLNAFQSSLGVSLLDRPDILSNEISRMGGDVTEQPKFPLAVDF